MKLKVMSNLDLMIERGVCFVAKSNDGTYKVIRYSCGNFEICDLPSSSIVNPKDLATISVYHDFSNIDIDKDTLEPIYDFNMEDGTRYGYFKNENGNFVSLVN